MHICEAVSNVEHTTPDLGCGLTSSSGDTLSVLCTGNQLVVISPWAVGLAKLCSCEAT